MPPPYSERGAGARKHSRMSATWRALDLCIGYLAAPCLSPRPSLLLLAGAAAVLAALAPAMSPAGVAYGQPSMSNAPLASHDPIAPPASARRPA